MDFKTFCKANKLMGIIMPSSHHHFNPLLALTYQSVMDLNAACQPKCTKAYWYLRTFMPTKKTQPSCPGSRDLNWTGKGLMHHDFHTTS
jgi:hypothetical protein